MHGYLTNRLSSLLVFAKATFFCAIITTCKLKYKDTAFLGSYIIEIADPTLNNELQTIHKQNYESRVAHVKNFIHHQFPMINQFYITQVYGVALTGFSTYLHKGIAKKIKSLPYVTAVEEVSKNPDLASMATPFVGTPEKKLVGGSVTYTGDNVAWVIDSGIDFAHPDLNVDETRSRSFVGHGHGNDDNGHGTHVAGIIAAKGKYPGVASGAQLIAIKITNKEGQGKINDLIKGVDYVMAFAKPGDVVNISLGGPYYQFFQKILENSASQEIFFVIAAGNNCKQPMQPKEFLASIDEERKSNIYVVASIGLQPNATNPDHPLVFLASSSNYGNFPNCYVAPGVGIKSTWLGSKYESNSGTSMAAPHVAGVLLVAGKNKNYEIENIGPWKMLKHK